MEEYLYHYTSIETLLLILKNKTIAFNSLINVDDLEECESKDIKKIGKICYISCWTDDASESIPMWSMYTKNMQGVRIRLKKFPFKKYIFKCGEYHFKSDAETYINYEKLYNEDKTTIAGEPQLVKVIYTNDESLIYPTVRSIKEDISKLNDGRIQRNTSTNYSFKEIGKYKRKNWKFQNEVRYIINMSLWSMRELEECRSAEDQSKLIDRIEDDKYKAPYNLFFLELTDDALNDIEILIGPKATDVQEEIVRLMAEKYCPNAKIIKSQLKIR